MPLMRCGGVVVDNQICTPRGEPAGSRFSPPPSSPETDTALFPSNQYRYQGKASPLPSGQHPLWLQGENLPPASAFGANTPLPTGQLVLSGFRGNFPSKRYRFQGKHPFPGEVSSYRFQGKHPFPGEEDPFVGEARPVSRGRRPVRRGSLMDKKLNAGEGFSQPSTVLLTLFLTLFS